MLLFWVFTFFPNLTPLSHLTWQVWVAGEVLLIVDPEIAGPL